jgi:small subunit ribosomal protein S21
MLIVEVKKDESIDRALKRYKRKFQKVGMIKQLRNRRYFTKPSVERRHEIMKAAYIEKKYNNQ